MSYKIIIMAVLALTGLIYLFRNGLSFQVFGGYSVSSTGDTITLSGTMLSVTKNGICVMGDTSLPPNNTNSIRQSMHNCSLLIKGGHVTFTGHSKLKINGKEV